MNADSPSRATGVPSYSASGRRLRNYSLEAIGRCLALVPPSCAVKRNRRTGRITSAQFLPLPGNSSALEGTGRLAKTAHMGQHYSYAETIDDGGRRAWRFQRFLVPSEMSISLDAKQEIEEYLRGVFRAVPLSCIVRLNGSPTF